MQAFAALIISIFVQVGTFVVQRIGIQLAIRLAVAAAWIAAVVLLTGGVTVILQSLQAGVPSMVQLALSALPSNTAVCIAAINATYVACWAYQEVVTVITIKGRV
jgi:putative Mn2+ efflux pump MntP